MTPYTATVNLQPLLLTFQLAAITTFLLFFIALPLAYWLAYTKRRWKVIVEALVSLPLVLPPTVLGFYLLLMFSPNTSIGAWLQSTLGLSLVFSFEGLVFASMLYSLPFMVQPIQAGLSHLSPSLKEAAYVLGKSRTTTLWYVLLPNIRPAIWTGIVLSFAHTIGEFGVVLMIGGNIPGVTKVASIAIYDEVESLNYAAAHLYAGILLLVTFSILVAVYIVRRRQDYTNL
ncbi:MAG: molybdate ABC transporter permease subunit [Bacteroidota bacterium]